MYLGYGQGNSKVKQEIGKNEFNTIINEFKTITIIFLLNGIAYPKNLRS